MANKSGEHFKDDLSAYLDGELPVTQQDRVDAHLPECSECRTELDELRNITKMVADLPNEELPEGFNVRLKMKRFEISKNSYTLLGWLPQPTRIAAFAATGILASLFFFNEVRYRTTMMLPGIDVTSSISEAEGLDTQAAMSDEDIAAARRQMVAKNIKAEAKTESKGDWGPAEGDNALVMETAKLLERSAGSAKAVRGLSGPSAAPAPKIKSRMRPEGSGVPIGEKPSYTNDELRSFLDKESHRLGIKKVVPAPSNANDPWAGIPDRPMTKDEARQVMTRVTERLRSSNRDARRATNPTVALGGGTPQLLGKRNMSNPVGLAPAALAQRGGVRSSRMDIIKVPGTRAAVQRDQAEAFLEEGQTMDIVQGKREFTEAEGRKFAADKKALKKRAGMDSPKPVPVKAMRKEQGLITTSGIETMPIGRSWRKTTGGLGTAGGAVLTKPDDFDDLWKRLGRSDSMPSVDFEKEMVIVVFAQRSDSARDVEIASVVKQGGRVIIRYRVIPVADKKGPSAPYHVVTVEHSDYPFGFVQVP